MTNSRQCLALALIFAAPFVEPQGTTGRPPRIICKPPTMKIVKMVRPTFPPDAKGKHIFGTVAVEVEVDKNGEPSTIKVLKGDSVLAQAVVQAMKEWRWKPMRLNGELVEVDTTITVSFEPR
jgi:TonB family protein